MRLFIFGSIRRTLLVLVLLAVFPSLAILLYSGRELRNRVVLDAENYALRQVQAMAAHHERVVENARLLLMAIARSADVRRLDVDACQTLLAEILANHTAYVSFTLIDINGRVLAVAPADLSTTSQPADVFQEALQSGVFTVGNYTLRKNERRVVVHFAQPVFADDFQPKGMLIADFDLNYFGRLFADTHLPEQSIFTLTDAKGMRLTRFPETEKYTWVPDLPQMVERMSGEEEEGTFLKVGVDGVRRLYSFKRLHFQGASFPYLMIRLGIPVDQALSEARFVVLRNLVLLILAAALALATAWVVGERTLIRRFSQLIAATDRLKSGELSSRTGIDFQEGELGRLANAFDSMAMELEEKEHERSVAQEELLRLNEELEHRVIQRTEQLAQANQDVQQTLEHLQRTQKQLVLSEKLAALGELVAGVAHEINTPVGVALSASSTLVEKNKTLTERFSKGEIRRSDLTQFLEDSREGVDMILVNLNRASDLIRSFKMVAVDQVSEHRRIFRLREYIDEILLSLRPKLKKTSHRIVVECDPDLVIESYPGAFSQILTNLIINSLVHAFAEDQSGEIRIEAIRQENVLEMYYSDNGKGMPAEVQDRVFEPFFTTSRQHGSTGLGLHIVFNLVTRTLGGEIGCESRPGQGTVFQMTIPV